MKHTISPAIWQVIANDPPVDPVAAYAATRGYPRSLTEVLLHFRTRPVLITRGTRFAELARAGWSPEVAAADPAEVDAYLAARPDWEKRGNIWHNHVAKARARDGELIILVNSHALKEIQP